jgi:hypothetical protein
VASQSILGESPQIFLCSKNTLLLKNALHSLVILGHTASLPLLDIRKVSFSSPPYGSATFITTLMMQKRHYPADACNLSLHVKVHRSRPAFTLPAKLAGARCRREEGLELWGCRGILKADGGGVSCHQ